MPAVMGLTMEQTALLMSLKREQFKKAILITYSPCLYALHAVLVRLTREQFKKALLMIPSLFLSAWPEA